MRGRTALDELSDLLDDLPMTSLQRHWADEYLRDLRGSVVSRRDLEEMEELRDQVRDLEWRIGQAASELSY